MRFRPAYLVLAAALAGAAGCLTQAAKDDISVHRSCSYCGMDRRAYGYSRMLIGYPDGSTVGVCSVHCAAADLEAHPGLEAESLLVADRNTRSLIDARKAFWVWGGKKRGVMTQVPKWAFGQQAAALAFIEENGGTRATWEEVLKASREEIARGE